MAARKKKKAGKAKKKASPARKSKSVARKAAKRPAKKAKKAVKKAARKAVKKSVKAAVKKAPVHKAKNVRKAKTKNVGEGDYAASRAFLKDQTGFVEKNKAKIPAMGKEAEAALDGPEGAGLRDAEAIAAGRSRDIF
jgi:hypothetical protein